MRFSTYNVIALSLLTSYASATGLLATASGSNSLYDSLSLITDSSDIVIGKGTPIDAKFTSDGKVQVSSEKSYYLDVDSNHKLIYSSDGSGSSITGWSFSKNRLTLNGEDNGLAVENDDGSYNVYWSSNKSDAPDGAFKISVLVT